MGENGTWIHGSGSAHEVLRSALKYSFPIRLPCAVSYYMSPLYLVVDGVLCIYSQPLPRFLFVDVLLG
jgi:hypothetical protein